MMRWATAGRAAVVAALLLLVLPVVAVRADAVVSGGVLAFGQDGSGQVGDGGAIPGVEQFTPVPVNGLGRGGGVVAVSAGAYHSLALRLDGSVLAWGSDRSGELGDGGANVDRSAPVAVSGLGPGSGVVAVAAGAFHSLALRADGTVLAWGDDAFGQLGDGGASTIQSTPVVVSGLGPGSGVVAVAAGAFHSLALRSDGSVLAWGSDGHEYIGSGQLGDGGADADRFTPVGVVGLGAGSGVVAVAAGRGHSLAVRSDGSVLAWGDDAYGQLGDGGANADQSTPVAVSGLGPGSGVVAVAGGVGHSLALRADGSVLAWGWDDAEQLGDGGTRTSQPTPVAVQGLGPGSGVRAVSAGGFHNLALRADGSVLAWGADGSGQLGDGPDVTSTSVPVGVTGLGAGSSAATISAGAYHSLVATDASGPTFAPVSPHRVWDSRFGPGPTGPIGPGATRDITVTGIGGVPASGVTAVVLNVTAVAASAGTFVTAWPTGEARPLASNLNIPAGDTRANLVTVKVGASGKVSFSNDTGNVDLIADVAGWYGSTGGQRYTSLSPSRIWDSRGGPGPTGPVAAGGTRDISVTGTGGVPASGVTAVVLNVTAVAPSAGTFVTAWPTGEARPLASNLNVPAGDTRPNLVVVKVGAGGKVSFSNDAGAADLIADVAGYFSSTGASLTSVSPTRIWDSRVGPGPTGPLGAGETRSITVAGVGGAPATGVTAVILNVTAVNATAGTFVTAWPTGEPRPLASNLNLPAGDTRANLVVLKVGTDGQVSFTSFAGRVDLIADVAGWYGLPGA